MSEEQLKAFLEAVNADAGLQEQLKAAGDADAVVAIAKDAGFMITAEELKNAQAEVSDEELGLKELEGVAGGFGGSNCGAGGFGDKLGRIFSGSSDSSRMEFVGPTDEQVSRG